MERSGCKHINILPRHSQHTVAFIPFSGVWSAVVPCSAESLKSSKHSGPEKQTNVEACPWEIYLSKSLGMRVAMNLSRLIRAERRTVQHKSARLYNL